jgi:guanylate kinase
MLMIISGSSASGKTTVANCLLERGVFDTMLRSATTRAPRGPGDDEYTFLTKENFDKIELAERVEYAGNLYGLPVAEIKRSQAYGNHVVIVEGNGMLQIMCSFPEADIVRVFLDAPDDELLRRLKERGEKGPERMRMLEHDRKYRHLYDFVIFNLDGDLERTLSRVTSTIRHAYSVGRSKWGKYDTGTKP